jgi:hypothetical protein
MTSRFAAMAAFCVVAACGGSVPDSNPYAGQGVGFGSPDRLAAQRAARNAALEAPMVSAVPEEQVIASETLGVLNATRTAAPLSAVPQVQETQVVQAAPVLQTAPVAAAPVEAAPVSNPGISDEQNFDAVASRETIESDAERLARQREAYAVVQPQALPERPGSTGTDIVGFALSTTNRVGEQVYRRSGTVSDSKFQRACARYTTSDQAQEAFLRAGGPRNDRQGLDPDGDGFACYWDPTPFRAARGG